MGLPSDTPIYEENEVCAVCAATEGLGIFDGQITVCGTCYSNGQFEEWLEAAFKEAVAASGQFEQMPDGQWRKRSGGERND